MVVQAESGEAAVVVGQRDDPQLIRPAPIAGLDAGTGSRVRLCHAHRVVFKSFACESETHRLRRQPRNGKWTIRNQPVVGLMTGLMSNFVMSAICLEVREQGPT